MTLRRILTTAALALMATGLASANSINCTTAGPGSTELGPPPNGGLGQPATNGTVSCAGITLPGGAVLNDIILTVEGAIGPLGPGSSNPSTITITNSNSSSQTGHATTDSGFNFNAPLTGFNFTLDGNGNIFDVNAPTGTQTVAANSTDTFDVFGNGSSSATLVCSGSVCNPYIGAFNIVFDTVTGINSAIGGGHDQIGQVTYADATATVQYDYTIPTTGTPEPTTMLLMGGALIGLGMLGKRLKKS